MASATFKKGSEEFEWFTDFWKIVQKFWEPEKDNPQYWEELLAFCGTCCDKYKSNEKLWHFSIKTLLALSAFLDEQARGDIPEKK